MKQTIMLVVFLAVAGCSSKKTTTSSEARAQLEEKWSAKVGSATKSDFTEQFGNAEWCRPSASGDEMCRFYRKKGTVWIGDQKRDKKSYEAFDEVIADFDSKGVLRGYKTNAQR